MQLLEGDVNRSLGEGDKGRRRLEELTKAVEMMSKRALDESSGVGGGGGGGRGGSVELERRVAEIESGIRAQNLAERVNALSEELEIVIGKLDEMEEERDRERERREKEAKAAGGVLDSVTHLGDSVSHLGEDLFGAVKSAVGTLTSAENSPSVSRHGSSSDLLLDDLKDQRDADAQGGKRFSFDMLNPFKGAGGGASNEAGAGGGGEGEGGGGGGEDGKEGLLEPLKRRIGSSSEGNLLATPKSTGGSGKDGGLGATPRQAIEAKRSQKRDEAISDLKRRVDEMESAGRRIKELEAGLKKAEEGLKKVAEMEEGLKKVAEMEEGLKKVAEMEEGLKKVAEMEEGLKKVAEMEEGLKKVAEMEEGLKKVAEMEDRLKKVCGSDGAGGQVGAMQRQVRDLAGAMAQAISNHKASIEGLQAELKAKVGDGGGGSSDAKVWDALGGKVGKEELAEVRVDDRGFRVKDSGLRVAEVRVDDGGLIGRCKRYIRTY